MIDRFEYWTKTLEPMFNQVYGRDWKNIMHAFLIAGCNADGSGLYMSPSSGRKLYDKDSKGTLYKVGHTAEQWHNYYSMIDAIRKRKNPCHILFWSDKIICIDCDTPEDTAKFMNLCKNKRLFFSFEPSNHGGHFFFAMRNDWPAIFTNATINDGIVIDSCFGPTWKRDRRTLYLADGTPVSIDGHYERGGRVLKTCITKPCYSESAITCPRKVSYLHPGAFEWADYPYKTIKQARYSPSENYSSQSVVLNEGERNIGLTRLLGRFIKANPDISLQDRIRYLESINNKISNPLHDRELYTIARSSMRWR